MNINPTFSIVIPAYNAAKYIETALQSVYNQTFQDFEIIVTDDGSTDDTLKILQSQVDLRLRVIHQANQGVSSARNRAFIEARGQFIACLDADDVWLPNHLAIAHAFFLKFPQYVWYTARSLRVKNPESMDKQEVYQSEVCYSAENWFLEGYKILECGSNFVVKRDIVSNVKEFYPVGVVMCEDNLAWSRLALKYPMIGVPNCCTVLYRMWDGSAIHRYGQNARYLKDVLTQHREMMVASNCPYEAKLFFRSFSTYHWLCRINELKKRGVISELKEFSTVNGKWFTIWSMFIFILNDLLLYILTKVLRIQYKILLKAMKKESNKQRIDL